MSVARICNHKRESLASSSCNVNMHEEIGTPRKLASTFGPLGGVFVLIQISILMSIRCNDLGLPPAGEHSRANAVFLSLDGGSNNAGILALDADSFDRVGEIATSTAVPFSIIPTESGESFFSVWSELNEVNRDFQVMRSVAVNHSFLILNETNKALIAFYPTGIEVFDSQTLSPSWADTSDLIFSQGVSSLSGPIAYFTASNQSGFVGVAAYDLDARSIIRILQIATPQRLPAMQPSSLAIAPSDSLLFISVFNWVGGGGYNSMIVYNLSSELVEGEYTCGAFAQLCASPDGNYVYATDPAGFLYQMNRTDEILRYDVTSRTMEVFLRKEELGLSGSVFVSNHVAISSEGADLYVTIDGDMKDSSGRLVQLLRIDTSSRQVKQTFSLPRDSQGRVTQHIRNITYGALYHQ